MVYAATDTTIGRTVAIKSLRIPESLPPAAQQRMHDLLMQEARAAGSLSHPHIVTLHSVESVDGLDFIVMEYLPGSSLKDELLQGGALAVERAVRLAHQICSALDHAHTRGVVHGDVKPSNIFLVSRDQCKLGDFGIARVAVEGAPTAATPNFGSLGYMAPEQMLRRPMEARSDIFSLGVTLSELLCGTPIFKDRTRDQILEQLRAGKFTIPRGVPPELEQLLVKALAFEPEGRPQTAQEFAAALAAIQETLLAEQQGMVKRDKGAQSKVRLLAKAHCFFHPTASAMELCSVCGKAVCVACLRLDGGTPHCFKCQPQSKLSQLFKRFVEKK